MAAPAAAAEPQASGGPRPPVCLLVLGMAGSGKTTFVQVTYTARAYWGRARGDLWRAEGQGEREVSPGSWRVPARGFQELASNSSSFLGEAFSDASLGVLSLSSVHPQCILGTTYRVVLELSYR